MKFLIGIQTIFKKMHLKMLSVKWHPFCLGLNLITLDMLNLLETYLHFPSILNNVTEQVFKILLCGRQGALEPT